MNSKVVILLLASLVQGSPLAPTQLVEACEHSSVTTIYLALDDDSPRKIQDQCPLEKCHLSKAEHNACSSKNVVLNLVQDDTTSYDAVAAENIKNLYMAGRSNGDTMYSLDGVNIMLNDITRAATLLKTLRPNTEADEAPGTKTKRYMSLTVDKKAHWSQLDALMKDINVNHVIYHADSIPDCTSTNDNVLCNIKGKTQDFLVDIHGMSLTRNFDFLKLRSSFGLNNAKNFKGFKGVPHIVKVYLSANKKVLGVACDKSATSATS